MPEDMGRDWQIVRHRVRGHSEEEVAHLFAVSVADVRRAVDERALTTLSAQNRVRLIYLQVEGIEELRVVFHAQALAGDVAAGALMVKLWERTSTLCGLNAPIKIDPISLAEAVRPKLTSTGELLDAINRLRAGDKRRKMNGGPGYSTPDHHDERDDEDAELIVMRERNDYVSHEYEDDEGQGRNP